MAPTTRLVWCVAVCLHTSAAPSALPRGLRDSHGSASHLGPLAISPNPDQRRRSFCSCLLDCWSRWSCTVGCRHPHPHPHPQRLTRRRHQCTGGHQDNERINSTHNHHQHHQHNRPPRHCQLARPPKHCDPMLQPTRPAPTQASRRTSTLSERWRRCKGSNVVCSRHPPHVAAAVGGGGRQRPALRRRQASWLRWRRSWPRSRRSWQQPSRNRRCRPQPLNPATQGLARQKISLPPTTWLSASSLPVTTWSSALRSATPGPALPAVTRTCVDGEASSPCQRPALYCFFLN